MSGIAALFGLIAVSFLAWRYAARREERRVQRPLTRFLNDLIARSKGRGDPFHDLRVEVFVDGGGYIVGKTIVAYLTETRWVCVGWERHGWRGKRVRYKLSGRLPPPADLAFPVGNRACGAFWFVQRMRLLSVLLAAYPRDRLVKVRRDAELERVLRERGEDPGPPAA